MVIRFGALSFILNSLMYKDLLTAQRGEGEKNSDGSEGSGVLNSFLENEPCLVHETSSDSSKDDNRDVAYQQTSVVIFCSINTCILKGDFLILSVRDENGKVVKTIKGYAGSPNYHQDHLEIKLYEWSVT